MAKFAGALLPLLLFAGIGTASARETHDEQLWVNITGMGSIKGDLVYFAEIQPRIGGGVSRLDQLLIRPAIGVKLSDSLTVYQGYARVRTPVAGRVDTSEDRSFQQISWKLNKQFSSRTRLEQRWLSTGNDMGWRLREMLRLAVPLSREKQAVSALGYVEGFFALNDTDWGARSGFDRVRTFIGAEVPIGGKSTLELGYLNQMVNQARRSDTMDHVASISVFLRR
ncbi:MAG TPA: DUF2490 domain-containing protein [Sphingobium sp.]|uniref:DUF2490 domain-containing protein n=1 Tax=Sphingobium sp. TaxID=1912891 RepID=UPI002ED4DABA